MPMQNLLLLTELGAPDVWPSIIYYFWQNQRYWACAHAEFVTFGEPGGIGCVSMENVLFLAELRA